MYDIGKIGIRRGLAIGKAGKIIRKKRDLRVATREAARVNRSASLGRAGFWRLICDQIEKIALNILVVDAGRQIAPNDVLLFLVFRGFKQRVDAGRGFNVRPA